MSRYFCIFQTKTSKEITTEQSKKVKTVSKHHNDKNDLGCKQHQTCTSNKTGTAIEGKFVIQSKCVGHHLKRTNEYANNVFNFSGDTIKSEIYNTILKGIQDEIKIRLQSPLYTEYENNFNNRMPSQLSAGKLLETNDINSLTKLLNLNELYLDEVKKPQFFSANLRDVAESTILNQQVNTITALVKDCVCYSDCNGYATCTCYGNCNHY